MIVRKPGWTTPSQCFLLTLAALLVGSALAALVVVILLPPPRDAATLEYFDFVLLMTIVGPILFTWALGPGSRNVLELAIAVAVPAGAVAALYFGFIRGRHLGWLAAFGVLWGGFGGFSAFVAISGSI